MYKVDARGLACPEPIIKLSTALKNNDAVEIIVDNYAAFENCKRFAESHQYTYKVLNEGEEYTLEIEK